MISRRQIFAAAALPFAPMARPSVAEGPRESPLDAGDDGPPSPVRTLDPRDPVARELARLYDVLRAAHGPEMRAKHALLLHEEAGDDLHGPEWEAHHAGGDPLREANREAQRARRAAYFALTHAVIEAHGGGTPWLSEWYRYGTAHRVVRVGPRVYSVCSDYDAEWPGEYDQEDDGTVVLSVIDL